MSYEDTGLHEFIDLVSSLTNTSPESFPVLLPRYGPLERVVLDYPNHLCDLPFTERVFRWNQYLLDNILADGTPR